MKVLVVGSGAREHAIAWKTRQSPRVTELFVAPGNAGTTLLAQNLPEQPDDLDGLLNRALEMRIDLTIVGPEIPLSMGIADLFEGHGLPVFGPSMKAAQIESSKVFAKELMKEHGIPTAKAEAFDSRNDALKYIAGLKMPVAIKADGLASGKGVVITNSRSEADGALADFMESRVFGKAGDRVLVEECLEGQEVSVFAFTDGASVSELVAACDYKRAYDGDQGPNTGGMGSYSPPAFWTQALSQEIRRRIVTPTVRAMQARGTPYRGVLYCGLMMTSEGPKVLEFNCRLGDPEAQVILPRLKSDLVEVILSVLHGRMESVPLEWRDEACVGVVMASGGYPGRHDVGYEITGLLNRQEEPDVMVFHAGTRLEDDESGRDGRVVTSGGRVLTVAGLGADLGQARDRAYQGTRAISFKGAHYRGDIALGAK